MEARKQRNDMIKVLKGKTVNQDSISNKTILKCGGKIKILPSK